MCDLKNEAWKEDYARQARRLYRDDDHEKVIEKTKSLLEELNLLFPEDYAIYFASNTMVSKNNYKMLLKRIMAMFTNQDVSATEAGVQVEDYAAAELD